MSSKRGRRARGIRHVARLGYVVRLDWGDSTYLTLDQLRKRMDEVMHHMRDLPDDKFINEVMQASHAAASGKDYAVAPEGNDNEWFHTGAYMTVVEYPS